MKKLLSIVLCIATVCSMSVTAFAYGTCAVCGRYCLFEQESIECDGICLCVDCYAKYYCAECESVAIIELGKPHKFGCSKFGTVVSYTGTGVESYSITVPSKLSPGKSGEVRLSGTWASNRVVSISAPDTVTLINSINPGEQMSLNINFAPIVRVGDDDYAIDALEVRSRSTVAIEDMNNVPLFGTWEGTFNYTVGMTDVN